MGSAAISAGAAVRSGFEVLKTALSIAKDAKELLPNGDQKNQVGEALESATRMLGEAEAALADALGHQLCRCQFPPTPMLKVGYLPYTRLSSIDMATVMAHHVKAGGGLAGAVAVHACPMCKQTDAPAYPDFARDREADFLLPFLATLPKLSRQPASNGSTGWDDRSRKTVRSEPAQFDCMRVAWEWAQQGSSTPGGRSSPGCLDSAGFDAVGNCFEELAILKESNIVPA